MLFLNSTVHTEKDILLFSQVFFLNLYEVCLTLYFFRMWPHGWLYLFVFFIYAKLYNKLLVGETKAKTNKK